MHRPFIDLFSYPGQIPRLLFNVQRSNLQKVPYSSRGRARATLEPEDQGALRVVLSEVDPVEHPGPRSDHGVAPALLDGRRYWTGWKTFSWKWDDIVNLFGYRFLSFINRPTKSWVIEMSEVLKTNQRDHNG